jgi:hypothetical protein
MVTVSGTGRLLKFQLTRLSTSGTTRTGLHDCFVIVAACCTTTVLICKKTKSTCCADNRYYRIMFRNLRSQVRNLRKFGIIGNTVQFSFQLAILDIQLKLCGRTVGTRCQLAVTVRSYVPYEKSASCYCAYVRWYKQSVSCNCAGRHTCPTDTQLDSSASYSAVRHL